MRILFIGGLYRGFRLTQRLIARGEQVVGAFVFEEDAHESAKYSDQIESLYSAQNVWAQKTRRITKSQLSDVRDRLAPDVVFCLGWRTLIPKDVLECAPMGGVAVHDSLLPRLRGFAPTNWGLVLGHDHLGATLFQLSDSVDAGDVYFQETVTPEANESYESIQQRIAEASVHLFDQFLDAAQCGTLVGQKQDDAAATFTCARVPADGEIDWQNSSKQVERLIRALGPPAPGAFTYHRGLPLYVVKACQVVRPRNYEGRIPGRIVDRNPSTGAVDVLCGEGVLRIHRVRTEEGTEQLAALALKSVRESLGLNHSQEIISLRARVEQLESHLADLQLPPLVNHAG